MAQIKLRVLMVGMAVALCTAVGARADEAPSETNVSGKVYEGEHLALVDSSPPLYDLTLTTKKGSGVDHEQIVDVDPKGNRFCTQTLDFDGDVPKAYTLSNTVTGQAGKLTVTPSELVLEWTEGGKTKVAKVARPALFAVGPSIGRLIERHLADLTAGRRVAFRMVVLNRLDTYGFRAVVAAKSSDEPIPQIKSGRWLRVHVEADSGIARLFAPKITAIVDAKTGVTLAVNSPMPSPRADESVLKSGTIRYEGFR
jgi:hypothetical protein